MTKNYRSKNVRIKWSYFHYLKEADGKAEATIDALSQHISRFEEYTNYKDFKTFNKEQAIGFKKHLDKGTQKPLSRATMLTMLNNLRAFFKWLAYHQDYKARIKLPDTDYFKMSEKDKRAAKAPRKKHCPTSEQIKSVISAMPYQTDIERRDRALIAFTFLTGMRDGAIASLCLKHITIELKLVEQHPIEVKTKFSKYIETYFFPVGEEIEQIVAEWVRYLKEEKLYGNNDPLFPRTRLGQDQDYSFESQGIEPIHWQTTSPIRQIFRQAFEAVNLPYFNPHLFRDTLTQIGERICTTPEEFKAWSQNFGHESPLTTFTSYGQVPSHRQGELIAALGKPNKKEDQFKQIMEKLDKQR